MQQSKYNSMISVYIIYACTVLLFTKWLRLIAILKSQLSIMRHVMYITTAFVAEEILLCRGDTMKLPVMEATSLNEIRQ